MQMIALQNGCMKNCGYNTKKTFFQTNVIFQVFVFVFFVGFIVFQVLVFNILLLIISSVKSNEYQSLFYRILVLLIFELTAWLFFRVFIRFEHNNIHIRNNKIYINDDWMRKKEKIQYYSEVCISEIRSIDIIWTSKNSLQKTINGRTLGCSMPKAYISFTNNNGEKVNMFILYMGRKTITKMIDCIKDEMIKNGNFNQIEDTTVLANKFTDQLRLKKK